MNMNNPESFRSSQDVSRERARNLDEAAAKEKQALEAAMQELDKSPKAQEILKDVPTSFEGKTPGVIEEPEDLTHLAVEEEPGAYDDVIYKENKKAA